MDLYQKAGMFETTAEFLYFLGKCMIFVLGAAVIVMTYDQVIQPLRETSTMTKLKTSSLVVIEIIDHKDQRYPTVGDWFYDKKNTLHVRVSDTGNPDYNTLLALHEWIESVLCRKAGITQAQVDAFDLSHGDEEPGDNPEAPYHLQHMIATTIEKYMAQSLGVNWDDYNKAVDSL